LKSEGNSPNVSTKSESQSTPGALANLRILDLSKFWAGPALTEVLGDMGAEVIKIEAIQAADPWRSGGARQSVTSDDEAPAYELSPLFNAVNRNKFGITLDLTRPRGQEIFKTMVRSADIVVENFTPRVMSKFGLTYESLKEINPRIIMISLPAFGTTGPWKDFVGFAFPTEQSAGFPHLNGYDNREPLMWGCMGADAIAGMVGLTGLLAALRWRTESGEGQYIDVSQVEAISSFLGPSLLDYLWNGRLPSPNGNRRTDMAPHGCYPADGNDEWVVVAVQDDTQWSALCELIGRPEWTSPHRFASLAGRLDGQDEIEAELSQWTSRQSPLGVAVLLQSVGIAAAPLLGGAELLKDEHLEARGFIEWIDREWVGSKAHTGMFAKFSRTPASIRMPAPKLGEHNELIYKRFGFTSTELDELEAEEFIGTVPRKAITGVGQ
jgi:crotonobetainyl-CoA:carnitine CoA-transferase CaiB-like acyl-CoA transferase